MAMPTDRGALLLVAVSTLALAAPIGAASAQEGGSRFPFLRELQDLPLPIPGLRPGAAPAEPTAPAEQTAPAQLPAPLAPDTAAAAGGGAPLARGGQPPPNAIGPEGAAGPADAAIAAGQPPAIANPGVPGAAPPAADGGTAASLPLPEEGAPEAPAAGLAPAGPGPEGAPGPGQAVSSYSLRAFRLGVLAGRDVHGTMIALDPVAEGLREALGRSVDILPMPSYRAMIDAQETQRIDGGFYSAEAYAMAEAQCSCLEPLVAPTAADGGAAYYAIIVAAPESGIAAIPDLAGKVVAVGSLDSVGARRMQFGALASEGFDLSASAATVIETESAEAAVRLVANGEADAAFAWSSLQGDLATGYSRGTLATLVANGDIAMDDVAVIWRSPAIAHGPVAVAKALPEEDKRRIEAYLVGLSAAAPAAYDMLNPFYPGGYVAVEPDDYRGLEALTAVGFETLSPASPGPAGATLPD